VVTTEVSSVTMDGCTTGDVSIDAVSDEVIGAVTEGWTVGLDASVAAGGVVTTGVSFTGTTDGVIIGAETRTSSTTGTTTPNQRGVDDAEVFEYVRLALKVIFAICISIVPDPVTAVICAPIQ